MEYNQNQNQNYEVIYTETKPYLNSPEITPKKNKNSSSFFKRSIALVTSAAVFGVVAAGSFYGVSEFLNEGNNEVALVTPADTGNNQSNVTTTNMSDNLSVSQVAQKATNSMVSIINNGVQTVQSYFGTSYQESESSGSGIIVKETEDEIFIATNYHVVENSLELQVEFFNDTTVIAEYKGGDKNNDIAVLSVNKSDIDSETLNSITVVPMGDSEEIVIGEQVVAIGNALGYGLSVTSGYVSALDRPVVLENNYSVNMIQTDAAINPGNSGGALLNMQGELIGINTAKTAQTDVEGIGYAIPISDVQNLINELIELPDKVAEEEKGYLGVYTSTVDPEISKSYMVPTGAYVQGVEENTPAHKAGIQEKDIIVGIDGYEISGSDDLAETLSYYKSGTEISITIQRPGETGYEEFALNLTLTKRE